FTMVIRISVIGALLSSLILPVHGFAGTGTVVPSSEASQEIVIQHVAARDGSDSGTIVNNSSQTVRDVQLLVRQEWLWNDEFHPATDSPGRTLRVTQRPDIPPHASASFVFQTPPFDRRSDGQLVTAVDVIGFAEVNL